MAAPAAMAAPVRNVLVVFSNNRLLPANIEVDRGLREALLSSADRNVELFAEFMDRPAFSGAAYEQTVATFWHDKYASHPPMVVVVAGQPALDFVLRYRSQMFPGVPVVHLGVDQTYLLSIPPLPADVVGVPVVYDYAGTIQQALRWHPHTRRLVVVTGVSEGDRAREADIRAALPKVEALPPVEFFSGLASDALAKRLAGLGAGDVVFTAGTYRDGAGREFAPRESVALMAAASGAPIYGPFSTFIGSGVVGGRMPTYADMGRHSAIAVHELLAGTPPTALRLPSVIPAQVQVDWRQVRKWHIAEDQIPRDAIVSFKQPTFWELYHERMIAVGLVLVLQAWLIAALLYERRLRRRTAEALEDSDRRIRLAAQSARLSIWHWDLGAGPAQAGTGVSFEQMLATVHPADRDGFERAVRQAVAKDEEFDVEYRVSEPGGAVRWLSARGRAEKSNGHRLMGVAMDITARKTAELQAEQDRNALTHMTRVSMMGQLSASIAHQLNQPLAAILGNAEVMRKMLDRERLDVAELKEICDDVVTEDIRAGEIIRRLSALYKRGEMKLAPVDLNELVFETLDLVRTELVTRHVLLLTELAPSLPMVDGGRVQLQQVLLNLILNAADAMSEVDAAARKLVVRTDLDLVGVNVRLCVIDSGSGIAPGNLKQVFDDFWSTKPGGIGVGLAICQSIIKAHRGTLTATNNPDGGATFCAIWPVRQQT